ncbi:MAG: complex I NDUFA9 subunit family protein [Betaproteobacteria bacterium]
MIVNKVLLLGGTGFVGASVAEQLARQEIFVTVPTRRRERGKRLFLLPTVDVVEADVFNSTQLEELVSRHDAVINLIGILHGDFERVHVTFPKMVAEACAKTGVTRLIHMSALNADSNGPSEYLRSRGRGEAAVWDTCKAHSALKVTMFRPSVVFGENDEFLNMFAGLLKFFPLIPLGTPDARFQPVWVEDVARVLVSSISLLATSNQTYVLVGPNVYTLRELVGFVAAITGRRRVILGLGPALSMLQATVFSMLPGKLITPDNVRSMSLPSTSDQPFPAMFGRAAAMESVVPTYLGADAGGSRSRYQEFRDAAGR